MKIHITVTEGQLKLIKGKKIQDFLIDIHVNSFFSREIDKNQNRQFFLRLMMVNLVLVYHLEVLATLYAIHAISWVLSCHLHCKISVDFILKLCSLIWQDWGSITKKKCWNFFSALNIYIPHLYPVVFMNIK